ncbi:hypothetical protein PUG42_14405 [Erwiniaceae bacterium L1_54_3]|nr:hypothetical protein [Erwiniaceae bacterium L1_54_3]
MKKIIFAVSMIAFQILSFSVSANDPTQNGQTPEFLLQALCRSNGHIGSSAPGMDDVIKASAKIHPPFKPGNSVAENYKIADVTYQNLDKKSLQNCHEYSDKKLTELVERQLSISNK